MVKMMSKSQNIQNACLRDRPVNTAYFLKASMYHFILLFLFHTSSIIRLCGNFLDIRSLWNKLKNLYVWIVMALEKAITCDPNLERSLIANYLLRYL